MRAGVAEEARTGRAPLPKPGHRVHPSVHRNSHAPSRERRSPGSVAVRPRASGPAAGPPLPAVVCSIAPPPPRPADRFRHAPRAGIPGNRVAAGYRDGHRCQAPLPQQVHHRLADTGGVHGQHDVGVVSSESEFALRVARHVSVGVSDGAKAGDRATADIIRDGKRLS
jgi:hypothetical protein